jgi:hypothetical protein
MFVTSSQKGLYIVSFFSWHLIEKLLCVSGLPSVGIRRCDAGFAAMDVAEECGAVVINSIDVRQRVLIIKARDALFLKFIFGIELYMFRTGFLPIIRSLVLYDVYLLLCIQY